MHCTKGSLTATFWLSAIALLILPQSLLAVGVSPGRLYVDDMANGIKVQREITVTRTDPSQDAYFTVEISGDGARYADLPVKNFTVPAGKRSEAYKFFVAPIGAQNGQHQFQLLFMEQSKPGAGSDGAVVAVRSGVIATVFFTVTDRQVKNVQIQMVKLPDTEAGLPISFSFWAENLGNVDIRPTKVEAVIIDPSDPTNTYEETIDGADIDVVSPFDKKMLVVQLKQRLPLGNYLAKLRFYLDENVIFEADKLYFTVHPQGTLAQEALFTSFESSSKQVSPNDLVKLTGVIQNTGQVGIEPILIIEIKKDGQLFDLLRSDKKIVYKGQSGSHFLTFRPDQEGVYSADAYFEYGNKQTEHKQVDITAATPKVVKEFSAKTLALAVLAIAIMAAIIISVIRKIFLKA